MMAAPATALADALRPRRWSRRVVGIALLWFVACLLWTAPAQLLPLLLKPLLPALRMENVSGGLWRGSAAQTYWLQNGTAIALGSTEWRLRPWSLLWLHPSAHISMTYGEQFVDADVRLSPLGRIALRDVSAAGPAQLLRAALPLPARGTLALKLKNAELSRRQLHALAGELYWNQAQWQWGAGWLGLGDYRCALQMQGDALQCALQGQGALAAAGAIEADMQKQTWTAKLQVTPQPSLPADFRQTLAALLTGRSDTGSALQVERHGNW